MIVTSDTSLSDSWGLKTDRVKWLNDTLLYECLKIVSAAGGLAWYFTSRLLEGNRKFGRDCSFRMLRNWNDSYPTIGGEAVNDSNARTRLTVLESTGRSARVKNGNPENIRADEFSPSARRWLISMVGLLAVTHCSHAPYVQTRETLDEKRMSDTWTNVRFRI